MRYSGEQDRCYTGLESALGHMQHTGQKSAGIVTFDGNEFYQHTQKGLVAGFRPQEEMKGRVGVGGVNHLSNERPIKAKSPQLGGFALAFDGYIANYEELSKELGNAYFFGSHTELAARIIFSGNDIVGGIEKLAERIQGPYCLAVIGQDGRCYIARDPLAMRAYVIGRKEGVMAAATCSRALTKRGLKIERDLMPGEIAILHDTYAETLKSLKPKNGCGQKLCSFLFGYWEHEDVIIDGIEVAIPKQRIGEWMARQDMADGIDKLIDIVVPIPGSGIPYAEEYAKTIGKPFSMALTKYSHAQRSYPQETLADRRAVAREKLSIIPVKVRGKRVMVLDDSIRRGTQIYEGPITMLKEAGAAEIHLRLCSPQNTCYCRADNYPGYEDKDLLANKCPTDEEMAAKLEIKSVRFIPQKEFFRAITEGSRIKPENLCGGCYDGDFRFMGIDLSKR